MQRNCKPRKRLALSKRAVYRTNPGLLIKNTGSLYGEWHGNGAEAYRHDYKGYSHLNGCSQIEKNGRR